MEATVRGIAIRGARVPHFPPVTHLWEDFPNVSSVRQRCFAIELKESPICQQTGLGRSLFVGKLGSDEVCLSADWARTKSVCRQTGLKRGLFVGKLGSDEVCLSANWGCAPREQISLANCFMLRSFIGDSLEVKARQEKRAGNISQNPTASDKGDIKQEHDYGTPIKTRKSR